MIKKENKIIQPKVMPYKRIVSVFIGILFVSIILFSYSCSPSRDDRDERQHQEQVERKLAVLRQKMVDQQIVARGIQDKRLIEAMLKVPRHEFVPQEQRQFAYDDRPLPIEENQDITEPYIIALMIESLQFEGDERVLEIGTGSGYQTALLAEMAKEVYTIEIIQTLAQKAQSRLEGMGYTNVQMKIGDGYQGWAENAPFDRIIVTAAPDHVPDPLIEQLNLNGKMVIPVGMNFQELLLITKEEQIISEYHITPVKFVPMEGEAKEKEN